MFLLRNRSPDADGTECVEVAENHGVEMYSPLNESQTFARGLAEASWWAQQVLPGLRKRYSNKLVLRTHGSFPDKVDLDFRGYDYITSWGACAWPEHLGQYRLNLKDQTDDLVAFVKRDGCENGFLLDFAYLGGSWYEPCPKNRYLTKTFRSKPFKCCLRKGGGRSRDFSCQ
ncbi:MAG TPA: hypothetical protein EYP46_03480 [Hadesarchaea archaeon]|nr:hypothetical protein [Hadesarchaea archaeon]